MTPTDLAYRKSAAEGASGFGLLIALYDTLAGNLRRAASAQRASDIEGRCREIRHAFTVLAYLDDCVQRGPGGELAQRLTGFYSALRRTLLDAQVKQSAEALDQQMETVIRIREHWQKMDVCNTAIGNAVLEASGAAHADSPWAQYERTVGGWSV